MATKTWNGGDLVSDNWSAGANWVGGVAPSAGDDLVFDGSTRLTPNNDYGAGTTFSSLTILGTAGNFVISGNSIQLSAGATALACNTVSGTKTINLDITFITNAPTITGPSGGTCVLGGTIATNLACIIDVVGTINFNGVISGSGSITKQGSGLAVFAAANTYTGLTRMSAGTLRLSGSGTYGGTSGVTTAALDLNGGILDLNNVTTDIGFGSITRTVPGGVNSSITNIASGHYLTIAGAITHTGGTVTLTGAGTFRKTGSSTTFTIGNTNVTTYDASGLHAMDITASVFAIGNGTSGVNSTAKLALDSNTITVDEWRVGATGSSVTTVCTMSLGSLNTINADLIVIGQKRSRGTVNYQAGVTNANTIIRGKAGGTTPCPELRMGDYNTANTGQTPTGTMTFANGSVDMKATLVELGMNNMGGGTTTCTGTGTLTIVGANSVVEVDTMTLGKIYDIGTPTGGVDTASGTLTITSGSVTINTLYIADMSTSGSTGTSYVRSNGTVNVNGGSLTVNTLFRLGDHTSTSSAAANCTALLVVAGGTLNTAVDITTSDSAADAAKTSITLSSGTMNMAGFKIGTAAATIGTSGGAFLWQGGTLNACGTINGTDGITKTSASTLNLIGSHAWTGTLTISTGTVSVGNGVVDGTLSAATISNVAALIFNVIGSVSYSGGISGVAGTLTKSGVGQFTLGGANTYTGATTVSAGALILTGTITSNVSITSGGTLAGTGTVTGTVTTSGTSVVAPGAVLTGQGVVGLGTLTVTGDTNLAVNGRYEVDLNGTGPTADLLAVTGTLTLAAALRVTSIGASTTGTVYTIATFTVALAGTFAGLLNGATFDVAGRKLTIAYNANSITLTDAGLSTIGNMMPFFGQP